MAGNNGHEKGIENYRTKLALFLRRSRAINDRQIAEHVLKRRDSRKGTYQGLESWDVYERLWRSTASESLGLFADRLGLTDTQRKEIRDDVLRELESDEARS